MDISAYKTVEKELVSSMTFVKEIEVEQHEELRHQLEQATRLGNGYHSKVSIYFHDDEGPKRVETTIWATGSKYICLKGGVWIPINRIVEVKY
ncbi:MAG: hypothetical protein KA264_01280 [Crocinitomicaceae bacterium]|jgi:hypothetical protein|nr:hypothetical protein [Crocinitomicaceae bacterium]